MNKKAVITIIDTGYSYADELNVLKNMGFEAEYIPLEGTDDTDRIAEACAGCSVVLAGPESWNAAAFERCPELKLLARLGAGIEKIDLKAASEHGVAVTNTPGANACSVAQHVVAFMLDLALDISKYDRRMRRGDMTRIYCGDVIGSKIGFIGFGNVARTAAGLLKGFGAEILAYDLADCTHAAKELGVRMTTVDEITRECDIISLHVPLTSGTRNMVDAGFLSKMKNSAFLINTSRGGVIDEGALLCALTDGQIAGAALVVYAEMPPRADNPLLKLENIVHTPYVAFSSKLANRNALNMAIEGIEKFFMNEVPAHLLNPDYAQNI